MSQTLAAQAACLKRLKDHWSAFLSRRKDRLAQGERNGGACEKVAENIIEDLFNIALDWEITQHNNQVERADIIFTRLGIKHLLIEAKRPHSLSNKVAIERALGQAHGYAQHQHVKCIAVSDGVIIHAADISDGGLIDRVIVRLDTDEPDESLWWLSQHGIYRPRPDRPAQLVFPATATGTLTTADTHVQGNELLHPRHKRPARCFAYVEDPNKTSTWHLPYLKIDGTVDLHKLPAAIGCVVRNYRGQTVKSVPETAIPGILIRLGRAAKQAGKLPLTRDSADTFKALYEALVQLDCLKDVL